MVKLLHLTSNLDDVLAAGEVKGHPNHYDIERGVSKDLTVIFGQVSFTSSYSLLPLQILWTGAVPGDLSVAIYCQ